MCRSRHMVGITAYTRAQLHIFIVGYLSVCIDDDLCRVNQREQRRTECIQTDVFLLVGDTSRPSGIGIEHRIHQRLYASGGSKDVTISLVSILRFQIKFRSIKNACITTQHVDRRFEFLLNRCDESTTDGLPCLGTATSLLQLQELLPQATVLPMAIDEHTHEQGDDGKRHQSDNQ